LCDEEKNSTSLFGDFYLRCSGSESKEISDALMAMNKVWHYQTELDWQWLVQRSAKMFNPKIDTENMEEMEGIVEGMKAARENK